MNSDRTAALFEAVPGGAVLVEFVDGDPIVRAFNDRFARQFGYATESLRGESLNEYIVPDDADQRELAAEIDAAAAAGNTVEREVTRKTADGTRDFLFRAAPFREGDTTKSIGIYVDVTDQHRERRRYEALIEYSTDVITILDADGTIRYESQSIERVLGYGVDDLVGENAFEYIHPDDRATVVKEFEQGLSQSDVTPEVEYRFRAADGSWRWLESVGSNHVDSPPIEGYVVNSRDVTDRKERVQQLEWYRSYVHYQQKQQELSEARVELNVLQAEHRESELEDDEEYARLTARIDDLESEIDVLETELSELEATYDAVPATEDVHL